MEAYQQRVVDEKTELDAKRAKLEPFIEASHLFEKLPDEEKGRLCRQAAVMKEYSIILAARIAAF